MMIRVLDTHMAVEVIRVYPVRACRAQAEHSNRGDMDQALLCRFVAFFKFEQTEAVVYSIACRSEEASVAGIIKT
jgi:hypothetical protein